MTTLPPLGFGVTGTLPLRLNDAHCHFFSSRFFDVLGRQKGLPGDSPGLEITRLVGWDHPGSPEALADRWAEALTEGGVGRALLIGSVPGEEEQVARAVTRHPDRFVGAFMLDPTQEGSLTRVAWALNQPGMRVVCLFPAMHGYTPSDPRVLGLAEQVAGSGAALFVHCGVLTVGIRKKLGLPSAFEARHGNPLELQGLALRHPSLPIIVPHFGAGFFRELLMVADTCPNVVVDTSSSNAWTKYSPGLTLRHVFSQALAVLGPERLLFGTDSSFFPRGWHAAIRDAQLGILDELAVPLVDQQAICAGNFDRLFPRPTSRP
ncbi:putative metal-dependent hydrolase of the TIM-barrel fold protein [Luteitalea pratensis]|uniref:Putative metal-dependent hydrolase of the TIM-barrel fold protein n=1 Tax=Luteitalea pratensis TaxID=1855912 RepID=A0A143PQC2_LUTPR|nr:amidohydrolase family protein [Luteitalea pratensis]AMY10320.1 putative metal-dependent hydrolase of the TIM-barrel fold protein [Luteitalea pratensis]